MQKETSVILEAYQNMYKKQEVKESLITETGPLELYIALDFEKNRDKT